MNVLNYKQLKQEFKEINFEKKTKKKALKKVIDGTRFKYQEKDKTNATFWNEIVSRVDKYNELS